MAEKAMGLIAELGEKPSTLHFERQNSDELLDRYTPDAMRRARSHRKPMTLVLMIGTMHDGQQTRQHVDLVYGPPGVYETLDPGRGQWILVRVVEPQPDGVMVVRDLPPRKGAFDELAHLAGRPQPEDPA